MAELSILILITKIMVKNAVLKLQLKVNFHQIQCFSTTNYFAQCNAPIFREFLCIINSSHVFISPLHWPWSSKKFKFITMTTENCGHMRRISSLLCWARLYSLVNRKMCLVIIIIAMEKMKKKNNHVKWQSRSHYFKFCFSQSFAIAFKTRELLN